MQSLGGERFINLTQRSVAETLQELGISQRFVDEIVTAVTRVNYGQSPSMPAFAGMYSFCI